MNFTKSLISPRHNKVRPINEILNNALNSLKYLRSKINNNDNIKNINSVREIKTIYSKDAQNYYRLAAASRRGSLSTIEKNLLTAELYNLRSVLEKVIISDLENCPESYRVALSNTFFGKSSKQGVSIRYPLSSCVPTRHCGGLCYGHDGRDREIHLIFRAALNFIIGSRYEMGSQNIREKIIEDLRPILHYGVNAALQDAYDSAQNGFDRPPRIRFSHIGEMLSTPSFSNRLAFEIKNIRPEIQCVMYTRHPNASMADASLFTINFTIERAGDPRLSYAPKFARIVSSAWDGRISPEAAVNFLEHHVERTSEHTGGGPVCPVTERGSEVHSCDEARCVICFSPCGAQ
jgi:hypothetical protein